MATVPPGTGIMIMANDEVEVFDNTIEDNQTAGLSIVSYLITEKPLSDDKYDPFCEAISVHDNGFSANGGKPAGALGEMLGKVLGTPLPDILYDGIVTPGSRSTASCPTRWRSASKTTGRPVRQFRRPGPENAAETGKGGPEHRQGPQGLRWRAADMDTGLDRGLQVSIASSRSGPGRSARGPWRLLLAASGCGWARARRGRRDGRPPVAALREALAVSRCSRAKPPCRCRPKG